jgi:hypothetical protein
MWMKLTLYPCTQTFFVICFARCLEKRSVLCLSSCISAALFVSNDQKVSPKLLVQKLPSVLNFEKYFVYCV